MKVLIIYTHPNPKSFNHAILETTEKTLRLQGHEVHTRDLYQIGFDPILSTEDFQEFQKGQVPPDIAEEHKWIRWAEGIIFIYPIWWYDRPALLKGWIDRTFNYGFAFEMVEGTPVGLFQHGRALILQTAGERQDAFQSSGGERIAHSTMKEGTLKFCGIHNTTCKTFYSVTSATHQQRQEMLQDVEHLVSAFT